MSTTGEIPLDVLPVSGSLPAEAVPPEGGYGWNVIFGCWILSFWTVGTVYCWGVIQAALVLQGVETPSTLSWIGSLTFTCIAILGLANARLIQLIGARTAALAGLTVLGTSEILSGLLTHKIGGLFVSAGIIAGVGTSLCFLVLSSLFVVTLSYSQDQVINIMPAQYFHKKRGLANGIVCAGGGLGGTVISLAMNSMIQGIGLAWAYRTLGLLTLATGLPAAWMIRERCPAQSATFIEWRLFRDFKFVTIFLIGMIATFPLLVPPFFIPLYSSSLGLSSSAGAALIAGFNISSAVGRLTSGFAADALGPLNTLFIGLFLTTVSLFLVWPFSNSLGPLVVFVIMNGASNGGFFATIPTVVGTLFGSQRVSVAMGMIVTGWAGGYLMGAPIAGYLLEAHGGEKSTLAAYHPAMFYAGSMALVALGLVGTVRLYSERQFMRKV